MTVGIDILGSVNTTISHIKSGLEFVYEKVAKKYTVVCITPIKKMQYVDFPHKSRKCLQVEHCKR